MVHRSLLRLFIAVELPSVFQSRIRPLQASLTATKVRLRLVAPENIHFTLKFLGETPATQVPQITTVLNEIKAPPIPLTIQGIGCFPNIHRPRVIWLGIQNPKGVTAMIELAREIEKILQSQNFPKENRPFKPHTTIARIKRPVSHGSVQDIALQEYMQTYQDFNIGTFTATQFVLKQSTLTAKGPIYATLSEHILQKE